MNYNIEITIDKPLEEVIEKFKDPDGLKYWMEGFQRMEHLSGDPGEKGAQTMFYFMHKNKEMQIKETILEEKLPGQIKFAYDSPMGYNEVEMVFEELSQSQVKITTHNFFDLKGLMKLFGWIMPGMFKKQSQSYMTNFKNYVEKGHKSELL